MHWLERWWCKKYNRPSKDPLLGEYTKEELMIEYLQDVIEQDPMEAFPRGAVVQFRTGDAVVDRLEEKTVRGESVDLMALFSDEDRAKVEKFLGRHGHATSRRLVRVKPPEPKPPAPSSSDTIDEDFEDNYLDGS